MSAKRFESRTVQNSARRSDPPRRASLLRGANCLRRAVIVCATWALSNDALEACDAALARIERLVDFPAEHERGIFVRLSHELRLPAALAAVRHEFQSRREVVHDRHVADWLIPGVVEAERELDDIARPRAGCRGEFAESHARIVRLVDFVGRLHLAIAFEHDRL